MASTYSIMLSGFADSPVRRALDSKSLSRRLSRKLQKDKICQTFDQFTFWWLPDGLTAESIKSVEEVTGRLFWLWGLGSGSGEGGMRIAVIVGIVCIVIVTIVVIIVT